LFATTRKYTTLPGESPVIGSDTGTELLPAATGLSDAATAVPRAGVLPYSNITLAGASIGFTNPRRVALVAVIFPGALPDMTTGNGNVVKLKVTPLEVPPLFVVETR
jgi:hypothetical protein